MKINNDIELEKDKIIKSGKRLAGKGSKVISKVLDKYDVSGCKVLMDSNTWSVSLVTNEDYQREQKSIKDHQILVIKYQRFLKRVKSGEVEKSISKYVTKKYYPLYVDHSRSYVKSESFYVCDDGQKLIKLSLHNTYFQDRFYDIPFIDLNDYCSIVTVKRKLDVVLKKMGYKINSR